MSMAASSSSSRKYDVFLNFRGEDTRKIFVSHLYSALRRKAISTFIDAEELRKGDDLSELLSSIEESRLSIVVFSQNYASSTWCLKELVKILACMDANKQIVVPIFYEVDPSDVRKQKRSFAEAFAPHERESNTDMEEAGSWRSALTRATNLSGWDSRKYEDDAKLIEEIVDDIFKKLIEISSTKDNGLIGMDFHMPKMHLMLYPDPRGLEMNDVRIVGVWGMGGIGKTTIARAVYDEIACRFEACCFLDNVKEGFMKHGKLHMQTQLLESISNNKVVSSDISSKGFEVMLKSLGQRKVLIVVDDVDKLDQIEALLGKQHSFGGGSRIIITTRDMQLLSGADAMYKPEIFSYSEALELFRKYAFRTNQPTRDYDHLSRGVIQYAQGLPLALKVLGAFLDNKTVHEWEAVLEKIRKIPHKGIHNVLKTSFDGLDDSDKDIFLDIACFLKGMDIESATRILDGCGFYAPAGIRVLINQALISVSMWRKLEMHDLLEEMGQKIVRQESIKEPGRRSRLWSSEDVHHVLTQNIAAEAVEGIILDSAIFKEACSNTEAFVSMTKLRLLMIRSSAYIYTKHFYGYDFAFEDSFGHQTPSDCIIKHWNADLKFQSSQLRCLFWHYCPLKSWPSNFQFKNLVNLDMSYSYIEQLWKGAEPLEKLKFINLSHCEYLKKTPDFTKATSLKELNLKGCTGLYEVDPSISALKNLAILNLGDCQELESMPSISHMGSLQTLDLSGCSNLEKFPDISDVMEKLSELYLGGTAIKELHSSINKLTGLTILNLRGCRELKSLPSSIHMVSLQTLDLSGCSMLEKFPDISDVMEKLSELYLGGTAIKELHSSINKLTGLTILNLRGCRELKSLPSSIHMVSLQTLILSGCSMLEKFPDISDDMEKLSELYLDWTAIKELPSSIKLTSLTVLNLSSSEDNGLVGMDYHMDEVNSLLRLRVNDVFTVGILGMGGIGKTTIARAVYEEIACQFEACCFLENVKEGFSNNGAVHMQEVLLSRILKEKVQSLGTLDRGSRVIMERLQRKKVFLVLDDVDELSQIEALLGKQHSFGGGSRVIITTRDKQLLSGVGAVYKPKNLSEPEALKLFKQYAFRTIQPNRVYDQLSRRVVQFAQGLPLALKVLGAFLCNHTVREWEDVLEKIRSIPHKGIHNVLKTSFDELDYSEQNIFLDIACFLKGMKKDYATQILGSCGFSANVGIGFLIERALVSVSDEGELEMHDLLEEMGREIVRQESIKEPGKRSRLWSAEDVHHVLTQNTATKAVESIILDLEILKEGCSNTEAFVSMTKLRLLMIRNSAYDTNYIGEYRFVYEDLFDDQTPSGCFLKHWIADLKFQSSQLRCLLWRGCPLKSWPFNFQFKNLVNLDMSNSCIEQLWEGAEPLEKLKFINLSYCEYLKKTPDFTKATSLEELNLEGCSRLYEVDPSISALKNLVILNLGGCRELKSLPSSIHMGSLQTLNLSGCSNLEIFPEISDVMEKLSELYLDGTAIKELPSSINKLTGLTTLGLRGCRELKSLPSSIHMGSLRTLMLSGCSNLEKSPEISDVMEEQSELHLDGTAVKELPS